MSHAPATPPATPAPAVTSEQYNAVVARLDGELHVRAQLEADLAAARDELVHLRRRLAAFHPPAPHHSHPAALAPAPVAPDAPAAPHDSFPRAPSHPHFTAASPAPPSPPKDQTPAPHRRRDASEPNGHDKEILSHCSDISGCKSGARTPDSASMKKAAQRKSSNNLSTMAVAAGVSKKSKAKKERPAKVKIPGQSRYWTPEEHKLFLEALNKYGHKNLRSISAYVGTRNMTQVRTHSQKYFMRLMREAKRQNPGTVKSNGSQTSPSAEMSAVTATASIPPRAPAALAATPVAPQAGESSSSEAKTEARVEAVKDVDTTDKYSVPNTCGMTLLCLVGQDTLPV